MVKVGTSVNEAIEIDSGKIVYDIRFPLYYNNKEHIFILNIEKNIRSLDMEYILSLLEER